MLRQTAYHILTKHLTSPVLLKHSLATEAAMRALALRFNGDVEMWGITGLLHDADYEKAKGYPKKHGVLLFDLEPNSIPSLIEHAIKAHNSPFTKVMPESPMDWAITCVDELTGLIAAAAQATPEKKLQSITTEMMLQRLKQMDFAKGAQRATMYLCEEKLGIPLEEFINITRKAMQGIHEDLGL